MNHTFYGGVHPAEHKELTEHKAVIALDKAPAQVILPMNMHLGAPCKPVVAKGDLVFLGQKVGEIAGLGAPVHASVSGKVIAVEPRPHPGGGMAMSVVIENDFLNTPHPSIGPRTGLEDLTGQEIVELVKEAGITGMGGAGFPTHVKLGGAIGKVDTIILNGAECEPYITSDHRLMLERAEAVIGGVRFIMQALELDKAYIGVEANKLDAVDHMNSLLAPDDGVKVEVLKTCYPQGAEKQLIQRVTGREVPPGGLPSDVGCCVFNVATSAAIYDAVTEGKPLTQRAVTVTGGAITNPLNVMAPFGTPVAHLIEQAGGFSTQPQRLLMGGPMMGNPLYDTSVPMQKGTNCILALTDKEAAVQDTEQTCIRCGRCVNVCPMHLTPLYMFMFAEKRNWAQVESYNVMDCIECGSCNHTCPARLHLVQAFRMSKFEIRSLAAKQKAKEAKV